MKSTLLVAFSAIFIAAILPAGVRSHCEIPCGIYDDQVRVTLLKEHITTIEKSMDQIVALSSAGNKNYNQLVRWVTNKEEHAGKFMEIVTQYFLTQRIKPVDPAKPDEYRAYQARLGLLHQMLVYAMKCKQTTEKANTDKLKKLVEEFSGIYFQPD
jgi:nickel superoxide dismutase